MVKVIVFDFDGVIIDSNQIKYDAFFKIFPSQKDIQEIVREVLDNHREKSRFFIIEKILIKLKEKRFSGYNDIKGKIDFYAKKYNDIVESGGIECKEIEGASESLNKLSEEFRLYINSTTPSDTLKKIIEGRSLATFFKNIYGGPNSKIKNLEKIIEKEKVEAEDVVVVGDGYSDLESARKLGCKFIGVSNSFNNFNNSDFKVIDNLWSLAEIIQNL